MAGMRISSLALALGICGSRLSAQTLTPHDIRNCRTPALVLHGANDPGVPVGQGYEFYTGLQKIRVEAQMVVYPREGHSIRERGHQEDLQNRVLAWFDRHLKTAGDSRTHAPGSSPDGP